MRMELRMALELAEQVYSALEPMCQRIMVAGSIRRTRPWVGNLNLVVLPRPGQLEALRARCRLRARVVLEGQRQCVYRLRVREVGEVELDVWFARGPVLDPGRPLPSNWGSLLLWRTGSLAHVQWLQERARQLGLRWEPEVGVLDEDGYCLAAAREVNVYAALRLPWVPPAARERAGMMERRQG